jgi:hypothetical protein
VKQTHSSCPASRIPRISIAAAALFLSILPISPARAGEGIEAPADPSQTPLRKARISAIDTASALPHDLVSPEGTTRWDLTAVPLVGRPAAQPAGQSAPGGISASQEAPLLWTRTTEVGPNAMVTLTDETDASGTRVYSDPIGGDAALLYFYPETDKPLLTLGARKFLRLSEAHGEQSNEFDLSIENVGIGWVHLPSGPHEVVLQRVVSSGDVADSGGSPDLRPGTIAYRWVDPLAGVVAEVWGPASSASGATGSGTLLKVSGGWVLDSIVTGAATLKIYLNEIQDTPLQDIGYAWSRPAGTTVASVTTGNYANIGALIGASTWDFSANTSTVELASTTTAINSAETCDWNQCGFTTPGAVLGRSDKGFNPPNTLHKLPDVEETTTTGSTATIWLRAGAVNEGESGSLGTGESRLCYTGTDSGGKVRKVVPLWNLAHQDANGIYMTTPDTWTSGVFNCEQDLFNCVCGAGCTGFAAALWVKNGTCGSSGNTTHSGTQNGAVIKGGVITLPSGHTFNSLLVRTVADFCVYGSSSCTSFLPLSSVRTVVYLWQVPHLGTMVRLQSAQDVTDSTSFTTLDEADVWFGLFPPRTITAGAATSNSVTISWDPGLDTHRISGYKVYWGTVSGGILAYPFNSVANPGQVSFSGTSATISGLNPGTQYFFTVTSRSVYTDPSSLVTTTYESLVYPTQVFGDPSFVYPIEVTATTASSSPNPKEASPSQNMKASRGAGTSVSVTYTPACGATDHAIYWGTTPIAGSVAWTNSACARGVSGTTSFDPGSPAAGKAFYFVVVGQTTTKEGSYGKNSAGAERPEAVGVGSCDRPQALTGACP